MKLIKAAAYVALVVTVIAAGYLCYAFYENQIMLRAANDSLDCLELKMKNGENFNCEKPNVTLEYGLSGGIAAIGLIASLALFGAAKPKDQQT
jgi:hypothetical protein